MSDLELNALPKIVHLVPVTDQTSYNSSTSNKSQAFPTSVQFEQLQK